MNSWQITPFSLNIPGNSKSSTAFEQSPR